jgi:uncharacterized protein (DUF1800 family)
MAIRLTAMFGLLVAFGAQAQTHDTLHRNGFEIPSEGPATDAEAARFLNQATFGATLDDIGRLRGLGYHAWLDQQLSAPPTRIYDYLLQVQAQGDPLFQNARMEGWFKNAVTAPDQLRQRVAYALSQIFVVSDFGGGIENETRGIAVFYDQLASRAFSNYRGLLEDVTLSPVMGQYLSMRGNRKPDVALNVRPDENYAREILQLFSIGLIKLNADGSAQLNAQNQPIPTYDQFVVKGFAHVFTGWNFGNCGGFEFCGPGFPDAVGYRQPMRAFAGFHHVEPDADADNDRLLDGVLRPNGGTPASNLAFALDTIANHPNVGPFIGRRLIQNLVTSNPSPAYLARVSAVFANNGQGVRGDLGAVVRQILLDPEARSLGIAANPTTFGKVREPILKVTHFWRAFDAKSANGRYAYWNPEGPLGQGPNRSPSVFNFFLPDYRKPGEITTLGLYSPELQIITETFITRTANEFFGWTERAHIGQTFQNCAPNPVPQYPPICVDFRPFQPLAATPANLIDALNGVLMSGQMSSAMRTTLITYLTGIPNTGSNDPGGRVRTWEAVHLILTSPQYAVQK